METKIVSICIVWNYNIYISVVVCAYWGEEIVVYIVSLTFIFIRFVLADRLREYQKLFLLTVGPGRRYHIMCFNVSLKVPVTFSTGHCLTLT